MASFATFARKGASIFSFSSITVLRRRRDVNILPNTRRSPYGRLLATTFAATFFVFLIGSVNARGQVATINWANTHQTMQGFGGYNAFAGAAVNPYDTMLFSTLGYSLLRVSLPLDDSCNSISKSCATGSSNIADMQSCIANGCKVWATVSSPPADMKTNGSVECTVIGATLIPSDYAAFASYMSNYIASLKTYFNIPLYAISAQNEPDTCANQTSGEAFSVMSAANLDNFIKNNLGPTLSANGQSSTLIMMPESSIFASLTGLAGTCMGDPACASYVGITAFHDYDNASSISAPYSGQFWETEVSAGPGFGPSLCGGCWDPSIADAIMWSKIVHNHLLGGVTAFHYFWYVDPTGSNTNSGLIDPGQSTPIAIRTYAIAQWAKFVRPGWVRVDATANPVSGVDITAFKNPSTGDFAIIAVNENASESAVSFSLSGSTSTSVTPYVTSATLSLSPQAATPVSNSSFSYTLSARSITTFVGSTSAPSSPLNLSAKVVTR
jgi:O-glycosyl hydrolase